jgi:hypothetical protein
MGKSRKTVPAALHTELSEYTSLLRALRTSDTLDLSSQLTKAQGRPQAQQSANTVDGDDGIGLTASASGEITPSFLSPSRSQGSPTQGSSGKAKEDNWTRWPLLEGDVHSPEFRFQDEIEMIASEALKLQRQEDPDGDNHFPEEDDEEARLPQSFMDSLTLASSTYLSQILSALAAHIPLAEKSMQNRIKPIRWEGVLDIVAVGGLVDPKSVFDPCSISAIPYIWFIFTLCNRIIEVIQHRMERLYHLAERHCWLPRTITFLVKH